MVKQNKIRVLVIEDSMLFREVIIRGLSTDSQIEVVAYASDPMEARGKIIQYKPQVITCDIQMPKMNGIEFVSQLLPQYYIPVIMVSSISNAVFKAMEAGAVDFVVKPDVRNARGLEQFLQDLSHKIKVASLSKPVLPNKSNLFKSATLANNENRKNKIIAIGASTGGTEAIFKVLKDLPPTVPGILVVQHIPPVFSKMFADRLNTQTLLSVKEAETGDYIEDGKVLVAPGDKHMIIEKVGMKYKVKCFAGEKVNGHCPSVDVLFESVAKEVGINSIGIILTGMGCDGAKGLLDIRRKGGKTIGQDEKSSVVYGMPMVAYDIGAVGTQTSLDNIPRVLSRLIN